MAKKKYNCATSPNVAKSVDRDVNRAASGFVVNSNHWTPDSEKELDALLAALAPDSTDSKDADVCEPDQDIIDAMRTEEEDWDAVTPPDSAFKYD